MFRQLNASYVGWQLWLNGAVLLCFMAVQLVCLTTDSPLCVPASALPPTAVEWRLSRRALPFFLISNACTGIVNLCIDTMRVGDTLAVCLVIAYLHLCVVATLVYDWCRGGARQTKQNLQSTEHTD